MCLDDGVVTMFECAACMSDYVIEMPFLSERTKRKILAFGGDLDFEGKEEMKKSLSVISGDNP